MPEFIDLIETEQGNLPINYNALANKPIAYIECNDSANPGIIRDYASGMYIFYGKFRPFTGSTTGLTFSDRVLVNIVRKSAGSHVQIFYPVNNVVQFLAIMADSNAAGGHTFQRTDVKLNDLQALLGTVGSLSGLKTTEKGSIVGAINELYDMISSISQA